MNKKMELLLDILLQQDDYLTASQLAQIIGVTERSIRNYVRNLNGNQYQEPLIIATNAGYKIQKAIYNESVKNQLLDKDVTNILFNIAFLLANETDFISFDELTLKVHYSVESIRNQVQQLFSKIKEDNFKLKINARIFTGIKLEGDEEQKRLFLESLLPIGQITKESIETSTYVLLDSIVERKMIQEEIQILDQTFSKRNVSMDFMVYSKILCHMLILLNRTRFEYSLPFRDEDLRISEYPEYQLAQELLSNQTLTINSESERVSLANYLITLPINIPTNHTPSMDSYQQAAIDKTLKMAEKYYTISIYANQQYRLQLTNHILRLLNPIKESIPIFNPYSNETKREYFFAYSIACFLYDNLKESLSLKIPESEVAYLAIRVQLILLEETKEPIKTLLIFNGKSAESALYRYKLQTYFPNIQIEVVTSIFKQPNLSAYKLIILLGYDGDEIQGENIVRVSHALTATDILRIQTFVDSMGTNSLIENLDYYHIDETESHAAIQFLLEKSGYSNLVPYFIKRESMSATDIGNKVALPHPFLKGSESAAKVIIGINKRDINWGNQKVRLVIVYIPMVDLGVNKSFFDEVYQRTSDMPFVNQLIKTKDKEEFIKIWNKKGDY